MGLTLDWMSVINIIGFANGLFLSFIILTIKKGRKVTNILLSSLIFVISLIIGVLILNVTNLYSTFPHLMRVFIPFYFTLGPCLFLYVKALTSENFVFKKQYLFHFLPFVLQIIYNIPFYSLSFESKINWYRNFLVQPHTVFQLTIILKLVHLFIYLVLAIKLLKKHSSKIKESYSSIEKIKLDWLRTIVITVALILLLYFIFSILRIYTYSDIFFEKIRKIFYMSGTIIIFFLGYKGLTQPDIFLDCEVTKPAKKYMHSTLTNELAEKYLKKILNFMETKKPYLEGELTLKTLSNALSIPYFHLSQVINEKLNQNFFDFISRYRVEEAKEMLVEKKRNNSSSILFIAYDSGFNSKSSFNLAFKKYTKMTPSQYLKRN